MDTQGAQQVRMAVEHITMRYGPGGCKKINGSVVSPHMCVFSISGVCLLHYHKLSGQCALVLSKHNCHHLFAAYRELGSCDSHVSACH